MNHRKWYHDKNLVAALPLRYRAYALYSRLLGRPETRRVRGGSFMLRALRRASRAVRRPTTVRIRGRDGVVVVTDFADERVLDVIHEIRGENPEYDVMRTILRDGDTFIDVGANYGTFSLLASRLVGAGGKVLAIEPSPTLAALIRESMRLSAATGCEVIEAACGDIEGESELFIPSDDAGRAGIFPAFSATGAHSVVRVLVTTLDEVTENRQLTGRVLLKIDVEGSDLAVLRGARHMIETQRPSIILEINPWSARAAGYHPAQLRSLLEGFGYNSVATMESYPSTVPWADIELDRQSNIVALP